MPELIPIQHITSSPKDGGTYSQAEIEAMQRTVINLFNRWQLSDEQGSILLGGIDPDSFEQWKQRHYGKAGIDLADRLSNLMATHKALRLLFKDASRGYGWIKRENKAFDGKTALDIMLQGRLTDLMRVRRYLNASRGQW